ncbi:MAG: protease pro-enzyme activation domain-containing protein [Fimbriimonas sp.]|nr:protease pro-enzyme activation domain-containing protein [Fimbriimonas sp.]
MPKRTKQLATLTAVLAIPTFGIAAPVQHSALDMSPPLAIQRAIHIGHASPLRTLHLAIGMPFANPSGIDSFVESVSNPYSPNYRQFLTPDQVGAQFGLSQTQVQQVAHYLQSQGMHVKLVAKNRLTILADSTVDQAEHAFGTTIEQYASTEKADAADPYRYSFTSTPSIPSELGKLVIDVSGLEDFTRPERRYLSPSQARTLYGVASMYSSGSTGSGRTIGISSWDGFRLSNASSFISYWGLPIPSAGALSNVKVETVDGGSGTGTQKVEGDLDIQCTLAVAPLANVIVYDGFGGDIINVLTQEVNDNTADIITESYGWSMGASSLTSAHNLHLSMTAQGITYLAATGDTGTTITYGYPDCEPEVLMVGGTSTTTDTTGNRTTETGWSGSGGGWVTAVSNTFNVKPSYQGAVGPSGVNYRLFPDIAANADPNTGFSLYLTAGTYPGFTLSTSGVYNGFGGTSAASPTMAASLADAEQQIIAKGGLPANSAGKRRFGRINDLLYSYNGLSSVFYDVTSGSNGNLPSGSTSSATAGWDMVTGWGATNFQGLVNKVLGVSLQIAGVSVSATSIEGGNGTTLTGSITLNMAAPTGGQTITLSSSNAAVTVPATVTVAAGSSSATFTVTTKAVSAITSVTLTGSMSGSSATANLTLTSPHPTSMTLSSSSVVGGTSTTGTVKIAEAAPTGGVVVTLTSSNTAAATTPASVTVASGATSATFALSTVAVASSATSTITATSGTSSATAGLTVTAATVSSLSLSSTSLYGGLGTTVTGTVTLTGPAPVAGAVVSLATSSISATLSATSITIPSGKTSGTFTFTASAVSTSTAVTITATYVTSKATATATISPAVMASVTVSPSSVVGGVTNPTVTVTLNAPAGPSGTTVSLGSSLTSAANFSSSSVSVPAGKTSATATVTSYAVNANASVTLTATSGVSKTATLTVTAPTLSSLSLSASSIAGNGTNKVTGTVTLSGPAGSSGVTVYLKSSNATVASVPASVKVAAGAKTATFTITPAKVTANTSITFTATLGSASLTAALTVTP